MRAPQAFFGALIILCTCRLPADAAQGDAWSAVPLGADRHSLLAAASIDPAAPRATTLIEIVRRLHEADLRGEDSRKRVVAVLDAGAGPGAAPAGAETTVPLPLTPAIWDRCLPAAPGGPSIVRRIVADPRAGMIYFGLVSLDDRTRVYIAQDCGILLHAATARPATFAAIARSLRVSDGRVRVPGGPGATAAWEALVGVPVSNPAGFFERLLLAQDGRLGWCFDTLYQLDPARQAYALGTAHEQPVAAERLALVYEAFRRTDPSWSIEARPFGRVPVDAERVLAQLPLAGTGLVVGVPASWLDAVFERRALESGATEAVTAPALLARLLVDAWDERQDRLFVLLYLQRTATRLPSLTPEQFVALGAMARQMPALALSLEHVGVTAADTMRRVADRAAAITDREPADRRPAAVTAFQAAIALVDRLVFVGTLDSAHATALLDRLAQQPEEITPVAHVSGWLRRELAPVLATALGPRAAPGDGGPETIDELLLQALAGRDVQDRRTFDWEGEAYRLDPAAAEYDRLRSIRERQAGPTLGDAYRLFDAAADLARTPTSDAAARARAALAPLDEATDGGSAGEAAQGEDTPAPGTAALARTLGRPVRTARAGARIARDVARVGEEVFARVMRSYVYACHLGDPDSRAFLAGDLAARHDLGLSSADAERRRRDPWLLPEEDVAHGRPWHVKGALLGLELPLGRFALRRLLGTMPDQQPLLTANERQAMVAALTFLPPRMLRDADRQRLLDAVRRGRERVKAMAADDDALDALQVRAGVAGWRAHVLRWAVDHEPEGLLATLTRAELFWIGAEAGTPPPDVWGASSWAADRAWRLVFPGRGSRELYAGRPAAALSLTTLADVTIHLAEALDALALPSGVLACVLPAALQDYFDEVRPAYQDDWLALSRQVTRLTRARVEDYVASLTISGGPLRHVDAAGSSSR